MGVLISNQVDYLANFYSWPNQIPYQEISCLKNSVTKDINNALKFLEDTSNVRIEGHEDSVLLNDYLLRNVNRDDCMQRHHSDYYSTI